MKYRYILLCGALLLLTNCSDWDYDHTYLVSSAQSNDGEPAKLSWKDQGFTLDEYHIYKQANMSPNENEPNSALPWKEANIPADQAVKYYQKWIMQGVSSQNAAYYITQANATATQYKEAIDAINKHYYPDSNTTQATNHTVNRKLVVKIIKQMQEGKSATKALSQIINQNNQRAKEIQKENAIQLWGSQKIYDMCHENIILSDSDVFINGNPYAGIGKCKLFSPEFLSLNHIQWISENQLIITFQSPSGDMISIYINSDTPIKTNVTQLAAIGIQPISYTTVLGAKRTIPSFHILSK